MTPEQQAARVAAVAKAIAEARRARGVWAPFEQLNPDQRKPLLGEAADLIAGVEAMVAFDARAVLAPEERCPVWDRDERFASVVERLVKIQQERGVDVGAGGPFFADKVQDLLAVIDAALDYDCTHDAPELPPAPEGSS